MMKDEIEVHIRADATAILGAIRDARKKLKEFKEALARIETTPIQITQT